MTAEDSLALLLDIGFSRDDWNKLKSVTDEQLKPANISLFPCYNSIYEAKNKIIDNKLVEEKMELTAEKMTLPMCTVGNNYLERWTEDEEVQKILEEINAAATPDNKAVVEFVSKSGQDGSNADTEYNQPGDDGEIMDDSKMLGSSFTAINLTHVKGDNSREIIVKNELCNSSYSSRPLWCVLL